MGSEITPRDQAEWEASKGRINAKINALAAFTHQSVREMLPDIKAIKERQLWRCGKYDSFADFCLFALGVSRQRIYKLLAEDSLISKTLGVEVVNTLTGETAALPAKSEPEPEVGTTTYEPPEKPSAPTKKNSSKLAEMKRAKAKEVEQDGPDFSAIDPVTITAQTDDEPHLPPAAKSCPHCGKEIE